MNNLKIRTSAHAIERYRSNKRTLELIYINVRSLKSTSRVKHEYQVIMDTAVQNMHSKIQNSCIQWENQALKTTTI